MLESAYQYRGFAFNTELRKSIDDRDVDRTSDLWGYYLQVGAFPHEWLRWVPSPLEVAVRHALVESERPGRDEAEYAVGANWYFLGHRNKVQTDLTWLDFDRAGTTDDAWRFRVQWDVSF